MCFFYYQEEGDKPKSRQTEEDDVKKGKIATLELYRNVSFPSQRVKPTLPVQRWQMATGCLLLAQEGERGRSGQWSSQEPVEKC